MKVTRAASNAGGVARRVIRSGLFCPFHADSAESLQLTCSFFHVDLGVFHSKYITYCKIHGITRAQASDAKSTT